VKYQSNKQLVNEVKKDTEITGIHQGADAQSASRELIVTLREKNVKEQFI